MSSRATVRHVIEDTLKAASKQKNILFRNLDPAAYQLMLADSDGLPDSDFAVALGHAQFVARFNATTFALLKDPRAHQDEAAEAPKFVVASAYQGFSEFQVLKVQLPDGGYVHLPYQPETLINKLLVNVCRRRQLAATEFTLVDPDTLDELDMQASLASVGIGECKCVRKLDLAELRKAKQGVPSSAARPKKTGPLFFLTPAIAAQYKTYAVIKINPYGVRQNRMMGIDATRITNFKAGEEEELPPASSATSSAASLTAAGLSSASLAVASPAGVAVAAGAASGVAGTASGVGSSSASSASGASSSAAALESADKSRRLPVRGVCCRGYFFFYFLFLVASTTAVPVVAQEGAGQRRRRPEHETSDASHLRRDGVRAAAAEECQRVLRALQRQAHRL